MIFSQQVIKNQKILEKLQANKESIEKEFGASLNWETLEEKRACRISYVVGLGGWQDEEKWQAQPGP